MSHKIRFIHTSDLHLGTPLKSIGSMPKRVQELFVNATYKALERIIDVALKYEVDFLVTAGDIYDQKSRSVKANRFLIEQLTRLDDKGIPTFIIYGNHDPLGEREEMIQPPDSVKIFGHEQGEVKKVRNASDDLIARVLGQSYRTESESRTMYKYYTPEDDSVVNIGLLHTGLNPDNKNYVPCSPSNLKSKDDIHYWALGHIHQQTIYNNSIPWIVHSGTPQGGHIGEAGLKGCLLVEAEPGEIPDVQFIPTSPVVWLTREIKIDEDIEKIPHNLTEVTNLISEHAEEILTEVPKVPDSLALVSDENIEDIVEGYCVRWVLSGRGEIHSLFEEQGAEATEDIEEGLRKQFGEREPFLWTESVETRTAMPITDLDKLVDRDEVVKKVLGLRKELESNEELRSKIVDSFGQIWYVQKDHEDEEDDKFPITDETFRVILKQAQDLVIEKIIEHRQKL